MKIYRAYKFRLYPNEEQRILIHKTFGCSRFVYNHYLDYEKKNGVNKAYDLCKDLKELEKVKVFNKSLSDASFNKLCSLIE